MEIAEAADLIRAAHDRPLGNRLAKGFKRLGARACFPRDFMLVIPGTNEAGDWGDFNLATGSGDSGRGRHAGFLGHARIVCGFARGAGPKRVLGHSLGAAQAQIAAASPHLPALCLALPRPPSGKKRFRAKGGIVNLCRIDDVVCHLPSAFLRFRHLGRVHRIRPRGAAPEGPHRVAGDMTAPGSGTVRPALPPVLSL